MITKNIPEFLKDDGFGYELVHSSLHRRPFVNCIIVGSTTTYERHLEGLVFVKEFFDLHGDLGAVHMRHTVVKQDYLVHSDVYLLTKCNPIFN